MLAFEGKKHLGEYYDEFLHILLFAVPSYFQFEHKWKNYLENKEQQMQEKIAPPLRILAVDVCVIDLRRLRLLRRVIVAVKDRYQ